MHIGSLQSKNTNAFSLNATKTLLAISSLDQPRIKIFNKGNGVEWAVSTELSLDSPALAISFARRGLLAISTPQIIALYAQIASKWTLAAKLSASQAALLAFSPHHEGVLATMNPTGLLRIFKCSSPHYDSYRTGEGLGKWTSIHSLDLNEIPKDGPCSSASVGSFSSLPMATKATSAKKSRIGLAWCNLPTSNVFAVSYEADAGVIRIIAFNDLHWAQVLSVAPETAASKDRALPSMDVDQRVLPSEPVTAIAWSPALGKAYTLLATGSTDGILRIYQIYAPDSTDVRRLAREGGSTGWRAVLVRTIDAHPECTGIATIEFDRTTSTLMTSGDGDATIKIWKETYVGDWVQTARLSKTEDDDY